jgi:benzoate membrane transport protein
MRSSFSLQAAATGVLITFVGFASTFAVIVEGLTKMGASPAEASSGLMAVTIAMGLGGLILSLATKMPISVAWSTPGAALLASSSALPDGFNGAVGAFMVTGALIIVAGLFKPLGRAVAAIPHPLGNAMLAGVLFGLCLAPVKAVAVYPVYGLAIIFVWVAVAKIKRILAIPAAVLVTVAVVLFDAGNGTSAAAFDLSSLWPAPVLVTPTFSLAGIVGIAVPLFLVTMASQNIPGIAVLAVNGYKPDAGKMFAVTGILSLLAAPFGSHAVNLAAITAALGAGPDAHPDPARRYWATATSGALYILVGLLAGAATAFIASSPPLLVEAVAGLALLGAFGSAVMGAVAEPRDREAAVITFVVTASGVGFFGISGAFWGLIAGGAMLALARWRRAG